MRRTRRSPARAELGGERWVVKAQIHAGGRGKAGGVELAGSPEEVGEIADELLGSDSSRRRPARGRARRTVLVEAPAEIERELYLGVVVDRAPAGRR